jgi:hypothetical protein
MSITGEDADTASYYPPHVSIDERETTVFRGVRIRNEPILDKLVVSGRANAMRSLVRYSTSISRSRM